MVVGRMSYKVISSAEDSKELLVSFDTFLFDCDGVLWEGDDPIPGSIEAVNFLLANQKQVLYVTNNSSKSRRQYSEKFKKLGFTPVDPKNIVSSGSSAAFYAYKVMQQRADPNKDTIFYIGLPALGEELAKMGLKSIAAAELDLPKTIPEWQYFKKEPRVGCVIVGADWEFNYGKATAAASYLVHDDVTFIGTNSDSRLPTPNPEIINCGTGSIIKMIAVGSGREPIYAGKPEPYMWEHVQYEFKDTNIDLSRTLMVGDSLNTDIIFANSAEPNPISSLLVQTGNHKLHHVEAMVDKKETQSIPTYVSKSLKDAILGGCN